ncbi:unnamed protein product [Haemonchus placei]|uniref:DNA polymerase III subunit alpha n=1 Tax=Haemonchus placei TaxID=6290 RepID=A0A0N4WFJ2_HAEPC|nr:unnamed protein product [Haemonchus placei]
MRINSEVNQFFDQEDSLLPQHHRGDNGESVSLIDVVDKEVFSEARKRREVLLFEDGSFPEQLDFSIRAMKNRI